MSENAVQVAEASAAAVASKATYVGGVTSFAGFVTQIDWVAWTGISIALTGLIINLYFSHQRNKREKEEHEPRMQKLRGQCNVQD